MICTAIVSDQLNFPLEMKRQTEVLNMAYLGQPQTLCTNKELVIVILLKGFDIVSFVPSQSPRPNPKQASTYSCVMSLLDR